MRTSKNILITATLALSATTLAAPSVVYRYNMAGAQTPIAIIDLERAYTAPSENCSQRFAEVKIDQVVYDGVSEIIAGFRAKKPQPNEWTGLFRLTTKDLGKFEMRELAKIVQQGHKIFTLYQICGSGEFVSVREIWLKDAVNNP